MLGVLPAWSQDDASWPMPIKSMPIKSIDGWRYSGLDQINPDNVARLAPAWTFSLGVLRGQEAAPIVAEDTMFVVTLVPNIIYTDEALGASTRAPDPVARVPSTKATAHRDFSSDASADADTFPRLNGNGRTDRRFSRQHSPKFVWFVSHAKAPEMV